MKANQKGFSVVEILIVIMVVGLIGGAGWYVWQSKNKDKNTNTSDSSQSTSNKVDKKQEAPTSTSNLKTTNLASNKVSFSSPSSWEVASRDSSRAMSATVTLESLGIATLTPPEKLPTIYGGGTEYFTVGVYVYKNTKNSSAKKWFETDYEGGYAGSSDKTSEQSINGYDTYYIRQINNSYDEIHYVFAAQGKIVMINARVSMTGYASDGSGKVNAHADFTMYVPDIEAMAKSVSIK
jgi:prepilin-type N-terminal cleavage/methylation domain-containing protein